MSTSQPQPSPTPLWTAQLAQPAAAAPLALGDCLLVPAQAAAGAPACLLLGLDARTGGVRWQHRFDDARIGGLQPATLPGQPPLAVVAVRGGDLLHGVARLLAVNAAGDVVWQWAEAGLRCGAPALRHGRILLLGEHSLIAIPLADASRDVRRIPLPATTSLAAPAVQDHLAYVPCRGPELLAVDPEAGVRWHFRAPGGDAPHGAHAWLDHTPALADTQLFAASRDGVLYALHSLTGQLAWQQAVGDGRALSPPAAANGRVYVGTRSGLVALAGHSGQVAWRFATARPISAAPLVVGDVVYAGGEDHVLYALDAGTGEPRWQHALPRRIVVAPAVAGDRLVVTDRGGTAVALPLPDAGTAEEPRAAAAGSLAARRRRAAAWLAAGEPRQAADLWLETGDLAEAAAAFETAAAWPEAADVWRRLDRLGRWADALVWHARQLGEQAAADEIQAAAWEQAARAQAEIGQPEARRQAEREAARCRRQPFLVMDVKAVPLQVNAWARLDFTIHNDGFGSARGVTVQVVGDRFEGHGAHTQTLPTILPGKTHASWLDVRPKAWGTAVPLRLSIKYADAGAAEYELTRTFSLSVAAEHAAPAAQHPPTASQQFAQLAAPDGRDLSALRTEITASFNKEELQDLAFDLGLRVDDLDDRVSSIARDLIAYAIQKNRYEKLLELLQQRSPHKKW